LALPALLSVLPGCGNSPYASRDTAQAIFYTYFLDDPLSLDPCIAYDFNSDAVASLVYPSYYQYHYLKRNPLVLLPALGATEAVRETVPIRLVEHGRRRSLSGERWTFRIKRGIHYQDDPCFAGGKGREVLAADFLNSFRRMADPGVACPIYAYFGDKVIGLAEYRSKLKRASGNKARLVAERRSPIEGLQLDPSDPYTFRIVLNRRYPQLRYLMALPFTTPLAEEVLEKYADERVGNTIPDLLKLSKRPVGCGPFVVTEYVVKSRIVLKPNPNRRPEFYPTDGEPGDRESGLLENAGRQLPMLDGIQVNIIRESITSFNQFIQGYEDMAGVGQSNYQEVMSLPGKLSPTMLRRGIKLSHATNYEVSYFAFNMLDPTFGGLNEKNRKLRQAISLAVDGQELIDLFFLGLGVPAQSIVPPGIPGYDPQYRNPYRQFDPSLSRAKQLLAEAGYPNGIDQTTGRPLILNWDNANWTPAGRQFNGLALRQIQRLGIEVRTRTFLAPSMTQRVNKGQSQFMGGPGVWGADYPDVENFVFLLHSPNAAVSSSGPNITNYNNPEYDRLFDEMRAMEDGPARTAIVHRMRAIVQEDCPVIPYRHTEGYGMLQPWLYNFKVHPVALDYWKFLRVDVRRRTEFQSKWNQPNYLSGWIAAALVLLAAAPAAHVVHRRTNRRVRRTFTPPSK